VPATMDEPRCWRKLAHVLRLRVIQMMCHSEPSRK
jgi:hypothetical protein